jgi:hypothetical protein
MILNIQPGGRVEFVAHNGLEPLLAQGIATQRRASHVDPVNPWLRVAFHAVRRLVRDDSALAAWTRSWRCQWRVAIIGGPVLAGTWRDRLEAIAAEVQWIERERFGA